MSVLKTSFEKIQQDPAMAEVIESLERGFMKYNIDFYLVGAMARDIWIKGVHDLKVKRATRDIDLGIMVKDEKTFEKLKEYLIIYEGFNAVKTNPFVMIAPNGMEN